MRFCRSIAAAAFAAVIAAPAAAGPAGGDVFARRTARIFADVPVAAEAVEEMTAAAFSAPTGGHQDSLHFIWVTDRRVMLEIMAATPYGQPLATAPLVLVIAADIGASRYPELVMFDSGAAAEAVLAQAARLGLASVPMSLWPQEERTNGAAAALGLPAGLMPEIMVAVGKPGTDAASGSSVLPADPARVHWNSWKGERR